MGAHASIQAASLGLPPVKSYLNTSGKKPWDFSTYEM